MQFNQTVLYRHTATDIFLLEDCYKNFAHSLVPNNLFGYDNAFVPTPWHGRSQAILNTKDSQHLIIKGVGCPYLSQPYMLSEEMDQHIWGLLDEHTAFNEFKKMQKVYELKIPTAKPIALKKIDNINCGPFVPHLIYYTVSNPFRLIDLDFFNQDQKMKIKNNILSIENNVYMDAHLSVCSKIAKILKKLYTHQIIHNALTTHNITCDLEIVDFESSFEILNDDPKKKEKLSLIPRELIQLREITYSVAWWFNEKYQVNKVDEIIEKINPSI